MPELNPKEKLILNVRKAFGLQIFHAHLSFNIPQSFLGAIICAESGGYKYAVRYEPSYFKLIYPLQKLNGLDVLAASSSHGAAQIMGFHSETFHCLGKLKNNTKCGTLSKTIQDLYEKPVESCAVFLSQNATQYVQDQDWESVAKIYNGGSQNNPLAEPYWIKIKDYMTLYDLSLKNIPSVEDIDAT